MFNLLRKRDSTVSKGQEDSSVEQGIIEETDENEEDRNKHVKFSPETSCLWYMGHSVKYRLYIYILLRNT